MAAPPGYRPLRVLIFLFLATAALCAWAFWPGQPHIPKLGLDLQGGTQVILKPTPLESGATLTKEQLDQTLQIVRQRVDGVGVAEADITIQGTANDAVIVVAVPGITQDRIVDLVGQTALLDFRPVEAILPPGPTDASGNAIESEHRTDASEGTAIVQATQLSAEFTAAVAALDCTDPANQAGGSPDDPNQYLGTCDQTGAAKYVLQPAFIRGTNVTSAQAQLPQQGVGAWVVTLEFDSEGAAQLAEVSTKLSALSPPQNQFAIVLDGVVTTAPSFNEPIRSGSAQIEGNFTLQSAKDLANILKFGALPLNLEVQAVESVSPTLGDDQLAAGILAGFIGLVLVGLYLIIYYRALGVVALLSLVIAGVITYASFVVLGRTIGFTLTLAGIAGAIVAIGITADSFVVYFERLRDEVRDGRSLRQAADMGWIRARRTLLAADFVSFLAAAVLYWLSVGNVRGFAFALGLTTIVDVAVAFWFTRPLVLIMCRGKWMSRGGSFTGVSPARLGGATTLAGNQREPASKKKKRPDPAMAGSAPDAEA